MEKSDNNQSNFADKLKKFDKAIKELEKKHFLN